MILGGFSIVCSSRAARVHGQADATLRVVLMERKANEPSYPNRLTSQGTPPRSAAARWPGGERPPTGVPHMTWCIPLHASSNTPRRPSGPRLAPLLLHPARGLLVPLRLLPRLLVIVTLQLEHVLGLDGALEAARVPAWAARRKRDCAKLQDGRDDQPAHKHPHRRQPQRNEDTTTLTAGRSGGSRMLTGRP